MDGDGQGNAIGEGGMPGSNDAVPVPLEVADVNEVAMPSGSNNGYQDGHSDADSANEGVDLGGVDDRYDLHSPARDPRFLEEMYGDTSDSFSSDEEMENDYFASTRSLTPSLMDLDSDSDSDPLALAYLSDACSPESVSTPEARQSTDSGTPGSIEHDELKEKASCMTLTQRSVDGASSTTTTTNGPKKAAARPEYLENCQVCSKPADFVCQGCYRSAYCSEKHQQEEWEKHRTDCVHFGLARHSSLIYRGPFCVDGNGSVKDQPIYILKTTTTVSATKEKILEEKPFLICPWPRLKMRQSESYYTPGLFVRNLSCFGCGKMLGFSWVRCKECNLFLCSNDCLYISQHQGMECKIIQQLTSSESKKLDARLDMYQLSENDVYREYLYMDIMIIRLLFKFEKMRKSMSPQEYADEWAKLDIIWKTTSITSAIQSSERLRKLAGNLQFYLGFSYNLVRGNTTLLWKMFSILDMNSFTFELPFRRFKALCLVLGMTSHSCVPNCHAYLSEPGVDKMDINQIEQDPNELTVVLKSGREIQRGSGLTFSYVPLTLGTAERRSMLLNTHFHWCMCSRCVDPSEYGTYATNIKCPTCKSAMLIPANPESIQPDNVQADPNGNPLTKPDWHCRGNIITTKSSAFRRSCRPCPPMRYDVAMSKLKVVEAAFAKFTNENVSGMRELLMSTRFDTCHYYQSAVITLVEDALRGTFFPLPDVTADDLTEYTDKSLSGIVMAKKVYTDFMKKVNPGFDFEGFPVANLELAENELTGREPGRVVPSGTAGAVTGPAGSFHARLRDHVIMVPTLYH